MRQHVTPSQPTATIPDPQRGDALPAEGRPVEWSAYWAGRLAREEITVGPVPPPEASKKVPGSKEPAAD